MRTIESSIVTQKIAELVEQTLKNVDAAAMRCLRLAADSETVPLAKWAGEQIVENDRVAIETDSYPCQDTGLAVVFADVGNELIVSGRILQEAINEGIRRGYLEARKSVAHPLTRKNTGDNTPAVIHFSFVPGDKLTLTFLAKGAGSENMSKIYMLTPSKGRSGIIDSVTDCVRSAGANPCPPIFLGVGIGGTMEKAAVLSKYALTRETGRPHGDPDIAKLEAEILESVNALGIGIQGLGGNSTCLAAAVEIFPTHIGMLPVAVNVQCHSVRHGKVII